MIHEIIPHYKFVREELVEDGWGGGMENDSLHLV